MTDTNLIDETGAIRDPYRNFIALSRYARWLDDETRRETWGETVDRYIDFFKDHLSKNYGQDPNDPVFDEVKQAILQHEVMPSMRALMTAGPALARSNLAGFNCSLVVVDHPRAFDEALFVLLNGTGVGFNVERRHVDQLPPIPLPKVEGGGYTTPVIKVEDSKEGWAEAFKTLLACLWEGEYPTWDMSDVRPAGARLKTFGGRASGPGPLEALFRFTADLFRGAQGRRLTPLECHDLMCKIGDIVVVGGVRRSALISLSDLNDFEMAKAKSGNWWENHGHRALANNSAVYHSKPPVTQFLREWRNLIESESGERGILNLAGLREHVSKTGRDGSRVQGVNPCAEIALRGNGTCNLSEVVIRDTDSEADVARKVRLATIVGTWQSTLTDFPFVRDSWRDNAEEERLLGVSLTGIYGNALFNNPDDPELPARLKRLRNYAWVINACESDYLGINPSVAITCVKPSGTVSQLTGVSSGIHPWHSAYYLRAVRGSNNDPLTQMMKDAGIPNEPDVTKPDDTTVFYFPVKAPDDAVTRDQISALDHLRLWSIYRQYYTDHNPSVTISVGEDEWMAVGTYVYENWDDVGGISFLPRLNHVYAQAPYTECTAEEYFHAVEAMPDEIRWADLGIYELLDSTTGSRELACSASGEGCETVDITS